MGLFAPWFLAGLAGVALPLYLHLLQKLKSTPKPVPSLMFFESRTQASTRHRRLRYYLLLALRGHLLLDLGRTEEAGHCFRGALACRCSAPERRFLEKMSERCPVH